VFLLVGIAGFIPAFVTTPVEMSRDLAIEAGHGYLFGLFPVNIVHNLVHIVFGIWGLVAYRALGSARLYARAVTVIYALLAILGLIPGLDTLFGLVPLHGHDVWLHILLAAIAAYFGFVAKPDDEYLSRPTHSSIHRT
jgi:Domain of unknown function (DUF4383)